MYNKLLASRVQEMGNSELAGLMSLIARDDIISFAGGIPDQEVFPYQELSALNDKLFSKFGVNVFQYTSTDGIKPLKEYLIEFLAKRGIKTNSDELIITTGSQQGLDLLSKILIDPGDLVFTEKPGYVGGIGAIKSYQADILGLDMQEDGIDVEMFEEELKKARKQGKVVKFVYLVPDFSNPSGRRLSVEKRKKVLELAEEYNFYIIEDTPYSELNYFSERLPFIKELDENNRVLFMGTFSKFFIPGLRIAWICAEKEIIDICCNAKQNADLASNTYGQLLLTEAGNEGLIEKQSLRIKPFYSERLKAMGKALAKYMPESVSYYDAEGGFFYWLNLPENIKAGKLFLKAIENKVAFVTGNAFFPRYSDGDNYIRMSFSKTMPADIDKGVKILADLIRDY
ncbi:aminotransferase-like domain-containing protein [Natronospora cellulosivora (SeqCode)]